MVDHGWSWLIISGQTWQSNWLGRKLGYPYKFNCWSSLSPRFNSVFGILANLLRESPCHSSYLTSIVQHVVGKLWYSSSNWLQLAPLVSFCWETLGRRSLLSPRISNQDLSPEMVAQKWGQPYANYTPFKLWRNSGICALDKTRHGLIGVTGTDWQLEYGFFCKIDRIC